MNLYETVTTSTSTKETIQYALLELLMHKEFSKVSVAEIAKQARINRGTFYLHFKDKDELLQLIQQQTLESLEQCVLQTKITFSLEYQKRHELLQYTMNLFDYIGTHRQLFSILLAKGNGLSFTNELTALIEKWFKEGQCPHPYMLLNEHIPMNYLVPAAAATLVAYIVEWVDSGREDAETMATYYAKMITSHLM